MTGRIPIEARKDQYHSLTAQCLYVSNRARPDLQQAVSFHCTRVLKSNRDDQKKLTRLIRYMMDTIHLPLILAMGDNRMYEWWIDASFATHDDMRSRTGMMFSLGKGAVYASATKQKLMTSSSTEAELVAVSDAMPKILWCKYFMQEQGNLVEDVYVYQDDQSAILLEKNGYKSVGKGTHHIKIKYFFVSNKVQGNELKVIYFPTEKPTGDFYTKPLQGILFITHRNSISGIREQDIPLYQKEYTTFIESNDIV